MIGREWFVTEPFAAFQLSATRAAHDAHKGKEDKLYLSETAAFNVVRVHPDGKNEVLAIGWPLESVKHYAAECGMDELLIGWMAHDLVCEPDRTQKIDVSASTHSFADCDVIVEGFESLEKSQRGAEALEEHPIRHRSCVGDGGRGGKPSTSPKTW